MPNKGQPWEPGKMKQELAWDFGMGSLGVMHRNLISNRSIDGCDDMM
jgi:hypothetical protein